jgi:hypothetical protein
MMNDFYDIVQCKKTASYPCDNSCKDEGICRCFQIHNVEVLNPNISYLAKFLFDSYYDSNNLQFKRDNSLNSILLGYDNDIIVYFIDRILRINKVYKSDNWNVSWSGGYYGDEIKSVSINTDLFHKIDSDIQSLNNIQGLPDMTRFILELEYGYVLSELVKLDCEVIEVDRSLIVAGQDEYAKKVILDKEKHYRDDKFDMVRAICLQDGRFYRLIDGYHRFLTTTNTKIKIINFYKKDESHDIKA